MYAWACLVHRVAKYSCFRTANANVVELSEEEVKMLLSIGDSLTFRACKPEWCGWGHLGFPDRIQAAEATGSN